MSVSNDNKYYIVRLKKVRVRHLTANSRQPVTMFLIRVCLEASVKDSKLTCNYLTNPLQIPNLYFPTNILQFPSCALHFLFIISPPIDILRSP